jgi:hypothetical protein
VAKGFVVLPKSVTPSRIASNLKGAIAASKALTKEEIERLDGVAAAGKQKRYVLPPLAYGYVIDIGIGVIGSLCHHGVSLIFIM